tara:strand:+ start:1487 stop:1915 length:429 start_codon:yes stop_codon:yes gene_type:complete
MQTDCQVQEVMIREVFSTHPDVSVIDCAKKMSEKKIGCLVVKENEDVIGIITEQDLSRKVLAKDIDHKTAKVKDVMSKSIQSIEPEKDIHEAILLMGNNYIKHLPVIKNEKLKGIITFKDIIQIEPALIEHVKFKSEQEPNY